LVALVGQLLAHSLSLVHLGVQTPPEPEPVLVPDPVPEPVPEPVLVACPLEPTEPPAPEDSLSPPDAHAAIVPALKRARAAKVTLVYFTVVM
jgi:hypothetical protein